MRGNDIFLDQFSLTAKAHGHIRPYARFRFVISDSIQVNEAFMKKFKITLAAFLVAAAGCPVIVLAHDQSGTLGVDASATDYYKVNCSGSSGKLFFNAQNVSAPGSAPLNAQIVKQDQNLYMSTTDNVGGDQQSSPSLTAVGGSGKYSVIIDKSGAGKVKYAFDFHCETLDGVHTDTDIFKVQDQ